MTFEPSVHTADTVEQADPPMEAVAPLAHSLSDPSQDLGAIRGGHSTPDSSALPTSRRALSLAADKEPPRIAIYAEPRTPPVVISITDIPLTEEHMPALMDALATRAFEHARELGGQLPITVFRELVENLVHASFTGAVVTVLDSGNTIRVSDRGPGIPDKEAALRPGFTSADALAKRLIRGVGSGFSVVKETLVRLDGALEIEDNLGRGTVVTARVSPSAEVPLASAGVPSYNLSERQLKTLLLTVELAPVGPTRLAQELGVSTSTAYRDLVSLEETGYVACETSGQRSVTESGLIYLNTVL
jgi:signal transduction histidine kinase